MRGVTNKRRGDRVKIKFLLKNQAVKDQFLIL